MDKPVSEQIISFYQTLESPPLYNDITALEPYQNEEVLQIMGAFYDTYYKDCRRRIFLIGINPGRLGGGSTGIPFTDPIKLESQAGIAINLQRKAELSSTFIYEMIEAYKDLESFYADFYFTSVSPIGFVKQGKNLNYYDDKQLMETWEPHFVNWLNRQLDGFGHRSVGIIIGKGKNQAYMEQLNKQHQFFETLLVVPHPRWVMQYRLKNKALYIHQYLETLATAKRMTYGD